VTAFGVGHVTALASDPNPFHTPPRRSPRSWRRSSPGSSVSVTSSYVAANTQTSRVIFAGARGEAVDPSPLAAGEHRFPHPRPGRGRVRGAQHLIGVVSTAFTDPATASGFLGTFGILGLIIPMYLSRTSRWSWSG